MPCNDERADDGAAMGRAIADAENRRAIADGDVHGHPYDGVAHDDCPRCKTVGVEHPQAVDAPVDESGEFPLLRDAVGPMPDDPPPFTVPDLRDRRPDGVRGSLDRLLDPERVSDRVRASRRHGVGALLPPLSGTGAEALGEVPEGWEPGASTDERTAERFQRLLDREEARERVREYVNALREFYGTDQKPENVIDHVDGSPESPALLLSDLCLLVGADPFEED